MKESIINGLGMLTDEYKSSHKLIIDEINNLQEYTIHRLLGFDSETKGFLYNKGHQFEHNSLFVIDEASMIDVCLFDSLLSAIRTEARVFMMGDKNQLPSVESGAVFGDLLKKESLQDNIIELDESIRFSKDTKIYELATAINNCLSLPITHKYWKKYEEFEIQPDSDLKPIYYFTNENVNNEKALLNQVIYKWSEHFYSKLQENASNLNENDIKSLESLYIMMETSKILCAENEGVRGIKNINNLIIKKIINRSKQTSVENYYEGELLMITKNNKMLDLYNGDCGILVTFKDDNTLYFMVKKASNLVEKDGKTNDKIFKLGSYVFYPLRMISKNEIDFAYAITIHKSQGSDYKNILVILPKQKGHPLLNRQIVYTAITRTKGNTYILSSQERLEEARDTVIIRDTNIV
jgi:exodeoxyribonuclease V alpha subunit